MDTPVAAATKTGPLTNAYVEVNNHSITNVGKYVLTSSGANVFDICIVFAANINYDEQEKHAYLHFNTKVQETLDNAETTIKPLQAKGIKVLLSVLGNHQQVGIANFPDRQAATAFAAQLANAVTTYGLDGIDFDDEYADYPASGPGKPNAWSFPYLVKALREALPNKTVSLYFIGEAAKTLSYDGIVVGELLDYAWNPWYGSWEVPQVPGMSKAQLAPAAIDIQATSESTATSLAERTMTEGYGVYNTYNLPDNDVSNYLSSFTKPLYGSDARHTGGSEETPPPPTAS
ncbi:chitinase [Streptomyces smyrnaeus]|uniref:Chitinase n=1 Tax=Streptomyces smyrnaeus TaxID=1387713 RepID=A0ABS3Y3V4_9ACTN|nr:endo-beta-N-acetylglucosaminidase H [Streptomyces smyrnaeus]MBO8202337.1 chitinase [Streptomyces smyrnaeus]